jgi:hypothetical protein
MTEMTIATGPARLCPHLIMSRLPQFCYRYQRFAELALLRCVLAGQSFGFSAKSGARTSSPIAVRRVSTREDPQGHRPGRHLALYR